MARNRFLALARFVVLSWNCMPSTQGESTSTRCVRRSRSILWPSCTIRNVPFLTTIRGGYTFQKICTIDLLQDPNPVPSVEDLEDEATEQALDDVLDQIIGTHDGIITHRYFPTREWLWRQWHATVFYHTVWSAFRNTLGAFVFCAFLRKLTHGDWNVFEFPSRDNPLMIRLVIVQKMWQSLMNLTTFLLTFFVGQAYSFWRSVYDIGRSVQSRTNDINLLLATHVSRKKNGTYAPEAEAFLEEVASLLRIYHVLMWATHARRFRILLTDHGLARLVTRGMMTVQQKETIERQIGLSKTERHHVLLEWVLHKCHQARRKGILEGGSGSEQVLLEKACLLQTMSSQLAHKGNGRMPLAYVHFVQILVDCFLFCAPMAQ